jgi:molecular chaperone IbpA
MRTLEDFSPLYRSFVGFDRIADLLENAGRVDMTGAYPPYDIEKTDENAYRISLAVAGFKPEELEIVSQPNLLIVSGRRAETKGKRVYLHHGIAARSFERRFDLADHVVVKSAEFEHGMLSIELAREVPERLKPRRIEINGAGQAAQRIEAPRADEQAADNQNEQNSEGARVAA